jgi:hypothetical protein
MADQAPRSKASGSVSARPLRALGLGPLAGADDEGPSASVVVLDHFHMGLEAGGGG